METSSTEENLSLSMEAVIGFSGSISNSLHMHKESSSLVYSLGSTLCIRELASQTQNFLKGHEKPIAIMNLSNSGNLLASADKQKSGFLSTILLWDWETKKIRHRLSIHKEEVRALCFSFDDKYLASVGGLEDKSRVIIWCTETGKALYGLPLKGDKEVKQIQFFHNDNTRLGLVSHSTIELLKIQRNVRKIESVKCSISNLKRNFLSMAIDQNDEYLYAGTRTGDILEIQIENGIFKRVAPVKNLFGNGVRLIRVMPNGDLLVASGSGTIARIDIQRLNIRNSAELEGSITGIGLTNDETSFFCGTSRGNIYFGNAYDLKMHLKASCHFSKVNSVAFPHDYSEVFATCGKEQVRVWNIENKKELLRMSVPHVECHDIDFSHDGKTILSAWSDGKIRAFLPQSGKLLYEILDAHVGGVTALQGTLESKRVVSGGMDGTIRIWSTGIQKQTLLRSMKEHRGRVWNIKINSNNKEALSCSADGSCIIWDIQNYHRTLCIFDKIVFKSIVYHPEGAQLLTTGSDRRIGYWEVFDGQLLRSLETGDEEQGEINSLSMMKDGKHFLSGGSDGIVKIWDYDLGETVSENDGHSGGIMSLTVSPDERRVVSVGGEGSVIIWKVQGK
jgi:WD40 repeat protein